MNPLISVVVPVYKTELYLRQCIESILNQTFKDYELILVDDGSPDDSSIICDEYKLKDERIKVIHKLNGGIISARKAGVQLAKGQYITHVDSDDWILERHLENYANEIMEKHPDVIITASHCRAEENNISIYSQKIHCGYYSKNTMINQIYPEMLYSEPFYSFGILPAGWAKCVRAELAKKYQNSIPEIVSMGDDVAWTYPCLLEAESISIIEGKTYMYRVNNQSITHTYNKKLEKNAYTLAEYLDGCFENKYNGIMKAQLGEYIYFLDRLVRKNLRWYAGTDYKLVMEKLGSFYGNSTVKLYLKEKNRASMDKILAFISVNKKELAFKIFYQIWKKHDWDSPKNDN